MPHVTFIHGIANKPEKETLLEEWEHALAQGGLDLPGEGVTTSMVYWADVMYAEPAEAGNAHESVGGGLGTGGEDDDLDWAQDLPESEAKMVASMRERLRMDIASPEGDDYVAPVPEREDDDSRPSANQFEAIPLPWFIKRRLMKRLLRDVHHYLFNSKYSPRPGDEYQVQTHIRKLFVDQLKSDSEQNEPDTKHVVVSHSMGTVISYDCLKNVGDTVGIDGYMTVGCPLGISEVHDNFDPAYKKIDAFPSEKVTDQWVNVFDRLDPVALDARLANDYLIGGEHVIVDQKVKNDGPWHHSAWKYFQQPALCDHLRRMLDL